MGFTGTVPSVPRAGVRASCLHLYVNNGSQLGKLRPRAAKDLLHTSKSKLLGQSWDWNGEFILDQVLVYLLDQGCRLLSHCCKSQLP